MDPNANRREQLEIALRILTSEVNTPESILDDAERLAELVGALDAWIVGGGFLPAAWQEAQR